MTDRPSVYENHHPHERLLGRLGGDRARVAVLLLLGLLGSACGAAQSSHDGAPVSARPTVERVSVSSTGGQANGRSVIDAISPDGRFVLFDSWATDLVPGDTNGVRDVFLRDLRLGRTIRVSVGWHGRQGDGPSHGVAVSGEGRFVLFTSLATDLANQVDRNHGLDVFVRDRLRAVTFRVSFTPSGGQFAAASRLSAAGISDNGRWVAMGAWGPTAGPCERIDERTYIRDRTRQCTRVVARCRSPEALSPSGEWLVVSGDRWGLGLMNLATGRTTQITSGDPIFGAASSDGRYVAYSGLGDFESGEAWRWDRITGRTRVVRRCGLAQSSGSYGCDPIRISPDGSDVALLSNAPNLVSGDTNTATDLFGVNMATKAITRLDLSSTGAQITKGIADGDPYPFWPIHAAVLSSDGRWAAFTSKDGLVVPGDTNHAADVFVRGPLPTPPGS
jgi:Tol biopolymer transport system component